MLEGNYNHTNANVAAAAADLATTVKFNKTAKRHSFYKTETLTKSNAYNTEKSITDIQHQCVKPAARLMDSFGLVICS